MRRWNGGVGRLRQKRELFEAMSSRSMVVAGKIGGLEPVSSFRCLSLLRKVKEFVGTSKRVRKTQDVGPLFQKRMLR